MQFVEVMLDPGESAVAEAGAMMYMTPGIKMETVFGDGSGRQQGSGVMGALLGAGKRLLTGESLFMTVFTNAGAGVHRVAFAAPYAGKILPMDLSTLGGTLICQKDSYLCAAKGVSIGIAFQKKIGVGLFGGEGFIMQKLEGDGLVFCHAGGTVHTYDLAPGETYRVDTGCLVALQPSVNYDVQMVGGIKTAMFGGEGLFFATLTGPGQGVAAVAAAQSARRPHLPRDPRNRQGRQGGRLHPLRNRARGNPGEGLDRRSGGAAKKRPARPTRAGLSCPSSPESDEPTWEPFSPEPSRPTRTDTSASCRPRSPCTDRCRPSRRSRPKSGTASCRSCTDPRSLYFS